jgi:hypothetical protein
VAIWRITTAAGSIGYWLSTIGRSSGGLTEIRRRLLSVVEAAAAFGNTAAADYFVELDIVGRARL